MSVGGVRGVVLAGIALGVASRLVDHVAPHWVGDMGAIWVLAAFWAGSRSDDRREGWKLGLICLVLACSSYYLWRVWVDGLVWVEFLLTVGIFWLVASIVVGGLAGYLGADSHRNPHAWGVVAGAFIGEAAAVLLLRGNALQALIEVAIGCVALSFGRVRWRQAVAVTTLVATLTFTLGIGFRLALSVGKALRRTARYAAPADDLGTSMRDRPGGRPLTARDLRR